MAEEPAVPVEKVDPKEETTTSLPQERLVPAPELTSGAEWPWKKVGGSPAAESTNVEVVEGPLTFQKALWDRFDFVWKQRVEPSQGQLQKLCDVLKARADLERKYGESLLGLGETFNPEPGNSLHAAREAMIVNFRNRGEQSIALADELEQDIIVSFECVIKQHNEVSKRIYSDVQLLLKHLQDKKKAHDKSARRYGSRCVEAESTSQDCLQAVSMKTPERLKLAQQATILSKQARVAEYDYYHAIDQVPVNIDPSHLAAMPTLRLELGSPLLMTALNWLKEEGLVLDEEKLESFELIGWNSLQLDLFVEDVTKKQELRLHDFQDPHHPAHHRVQVDLGDELDAQMVDDLLLALQGYAFLPMPDDPENEAASPKGRYVLVGVYFSMLLVIAKVAHAKKVKAIEQHGEIKAHFSGSYGVFFLFLTTFSTVYSGYTVIGIPEEAFARGFVALRWIGATLMIVAGMLVFNPRLRRVAILRGYTSPLDFINDRYGTMRLRLLCTICGVIPIIGYITAQIVSFAAMLEGMTLGAIPKWSCMLIFCVMILTLEFLGGMNSVVLTDAIQSVVMIASFLAIPIVLAAQYGTIPSLGPPDCGFLRGVNTSAPVASAYVVPAECTVEGAGNGCMPAGCIAAVNPEFYQFPSRAVGCEIAFFLLNMLTAPLSPHFIQRTYIATSDQDLRVVMAAMLVAPFIAQIPGIVLGLTKSAYDPLFPVVDQDATAFSGLSAQLKMAGPLQYVLVTVMTCSTLAAIMSTADSAVMGASSIVSIDLLKGTLLPKLTTKQVVRAGECSSVLICALASCLGMLCSSDQLGAMMVFQGGISMQTLPAFGLGLYVPIREPAVSAGLLVGLISFPMMMLAGNPVEDYVPTVYLAALLNFLTVALVQLFTPQAPTSEKQGLTIQAIREAMVSSKEPKLSLIFLMLALAMASAPWYGVPGEEEPILFGLPRWGLFQFGAFVMMFLLGLIACFLWKPPERAAEQGSEPPKRMSGEDGTDISSL
ncbi:unnamed protein product [Durusdinium trenchii]|uniref:Uncharacterized protein n=1 Tax=Durusdinium trenchii TaxID=1381693 RepID=A0ABP0QV70_9DINO